MVTTLLMVFALGGCGLTLDADSRQRNDESPDATVADGAPPPPPPDASSLDADPMDGAPLPMDGTIDRPDAPSPADAAAEAMILPEAGVMDVGPSCSVGRPSVIEIVCEAGGAIRLDLTAEFPGCGCVRGYATVLDSAGTTWTQSDEMLDPAGTIVFDATERFVLGGADRTHSYDVEVCCQRSDGTLSCPTWSVTTLVGCD
jgi:hypothetical protein